VALQLVDPRFYHLDTCLCPLSGGHLMYYPAAFDAASQAAIVARVPQDKRIAVSEEDALAFACNAVNLDDLVILNRASESLRGRLDEAGYRVQETPLHEFLKAGGSAKCLTLRLDEPGLA
jgi:N-dimethylarginine dimethylaminohydrolase